LVFLGGAVRLVVHNRSRRPVDELVAAGDAARVRQALLGGFAASRVLEVHGERMLTSNYTPGFRARLYQKDLRIAQESAAALGVTLPATAVVAGLVDTLVARGDGDLDYSAVGTVLFDKAGAGR
jgi:2-hydroxy-3-oxopropionate reductase